MAPMNFAGCDVGSLTAKAAVIRDGVLIASHIIRVESTPETSAGTVMRAALDKAGMEFDDIAYCCSTGYGRLRIPFARKNVTEISCHGLGAFWLNPSIRTVIDIGGQDCKVIVINRSGMVLNFVMNDKCAAGTGKHLEILARAIGVDIAGLGAMSVKSRKPVSLTDKCGLFMEHEVLQHLYVKTRIRDIAGGVSNAVARRVASLAGRISGQAPYAITGGVSKNIGVVRELEHMLGVRFEPLNQDPQLAGAIGAAVFAQMKMEKQGMVKA